MTISSPAPARTQENSARPHTTMRNLARLINPLVVRFAGTQRNTTMLYNLRIDADYREPAGGFRPVKVTYAWEENGKPKQDVHVVRKPDETYLITCAAKPLMKSIVVETHWSRQHAH